MSRHNVVMGHELRSALLVMMGVLAAAAGAAGRVSQPEAPARQTYNPGGVEFAPEPLRIEGMGLTMMVPLGATAQAANVGTLATVRIEPEAAPGKKPEWMVDIQTIGEIPDEAPIAGTDPGAPVEGLSNAIMADRTIRNIRRNYGKVDQNGEVVESRARLLYREENLTIKRGDSERTLGAERFYIAIPDGTNQGFLVRGSTFCQIAPGRFATFTLWVREMDFEKTRPVYEAMVASAILSDPAEINLARAALVEAGKRLMAGLTEEDYAAVISARGERWDRLYKVPASGDDAMATERGYRRTRVWRGRQGEMNPERDPAKWRKSEQTEGYLVSYEYRLLNDPEHPPADGQWSMSDASALYFMSLDGTEEMWVVRQTERGPGARDGTIKETGARSGNKMQVSIEGPGINPTAVKPIFNGDGYISQVQTFLLPQLMVRAGAAADYGFYCYQSANQKVQLRRDSLRRPSGGLDVWELRLKLTENSPELRMVFTDQGELIRSELPDGWIWAPTTADRLVALWQRKGLPME